jgi:uncharacterized protein YjbI with pentapeptide repeats
VARRQRSHHQVHEPWALRNTLAILVAGGAGAILAFTLSYWAAEGDDKDRFDVGIKAATATAAVVAGVLTWGRLELSRGAQRLVVDRDLTERYGRAVEQLGDDEMIIRVGGVFAMERFALDAFALSGVERDTDWRMALDLLADFAREHSSQPGITEQPATSPSGPTAQDDSPDDLPVGDPRAPVDVVAAVRVLGRFVHRAGLPIDVWSQLSVRYELSGIQVADADLTGACLRGGRLAGAELSGTNLYDADLYGADLSDADLRFANLTDANLSDADLSEANLIGTNLRGADLSDANLSDANFGATDFSGANLSGADLNAADLSRGNLRGANLSGAFLSLADLPNADLSDLNLSGADLSHVDFSGANLSGANLSDADLMDANLTGANLSEANLDGVLYDDETEWPEDFEPPPSSG